MFQTILVNPLLNALVLLYNSAAFGDFGVAIIFLTVIIRFILLPLFYKSARNQMIIQKLQPEIAKIQHDHKDNREKQAQAMLELYRSHKINPFSSFLMLGLQLPILIALYQVFLFGFSPEIFDRLYSFVVRPAVLNTSFLGLIDLQKSSILIVSLAALSQYLQGRLMLPPKTSGQVLSPQEQVGRQMVFIGPVLTIVILGGLPSAIGLYWTITSIFSIIQQIYINKTLKMEEEKKAHLK